MITAEEREKPSPFSLSCEKCAHVKVCSVFRAIAPLLQSFGDAKPFEPEKLATICREYANSEIITILKEA